MNREEYIELRIKNARIGILLGAAKERNYKGDLLGLTMLLMNWGVPSDFKEYLIDRIINFYDIKFNLTLVTSNTIILKII